MCWGTTRNQSCLTIPTIPTMHIGQAPEGPGDSRQSLEQGVPTHLVPGSTSPGSQMSLGSLDRSVDPLLPMSFHCLSHCYRSPVALSHPVPLSRTS